MRAKVGVIEERRFGLFRNLFRSSLPVFIASLEKIARVSSPHEDLSEKVFGSNDENAIKLGTSNRKSPSATFVYRP